MSHFLGTPARSHIWMLAYSQLSDHAKGLRKRLLSGPVVDIYIGATREHWVVHQNLLNYYSNYFETDLHAHEVSNDQNATTLELPDDDPKGFEILVKWLYQGLLDDTSGFSDEQKYDYAVACHGLYLLCHRLDLSLLKNFAIDLYRQNLHEAQLVPDAEEINNIYRASSPDSPFRKLMVHIAARQLMDPEVDRDAKTYRSCFDDPDFSIEIINAIRGMTGGMLLQDPTGGNACDWHDHEDQSTCIGVGDLSKPAIYTRRPVKRTADLNKGSAKAEDSTPRIIASSGVKKLSRRKAQLEKTLLTTSGPSELSEVQPSRSDETPSQAGEGLKETMSNDGQLERPSTPRRKPRKLERSWPNSSLANGTVKKPFNVPNQSKKLSQRPRLESGQSIDLAQRNGARARITATPSKYISRAATTRPPDSISKLQDRNYVNGVVRQFDGSDTAASEVGKD